MTSNQDSRRDGAWLQQTLARQTDGSTRTSTRPSTKQRAQSRPSTARPRSAVSTLGVENQEIICAINESRGISPVVGMSFLNLDTGEAVLSEINDSQMYARTIHKLAVFNPTIILVVSSAANPPSKLFAILQESLDVIEGDIVLIDRKYFAETTGLEYIQQYAFTDDLDNINTSTSGKYYAVCCFAAVIKYIELGLSKAFPYQSLRIKYEPAEGCMMIDVSTIRSLEIIQNLTDAKSKACLFGILNNTQTPMGCRLLRSNVLQPLTDVETLSTRYDAVEELSSKEEMFTTIRPAMKHFLDADRTLTQLILLPSVSSLQVTEQAINNVILLKQFVQQIQTILTGLAGASSSLLKDILTLCSSPDVSQVRSLIDAVINEDTMYASKPLELRNQRTYAVRSGVNGLLDVARQTYKESMEDAMAHIADFATNHNLTIETKFDNARRFYMRIHQSELQNGALPPDCLNQLRKKEYYECQTMELLKLNQKVNDSHVEAIAMSDKAIQQLIASVRQYVASLFKICEGVALLDMLSSFAQSNINHDYVRPCFNDTMALKAMRHPVRERYQIGSFISNDVYATQQQRFHVVTGCNMSGKSTYIRSVALNTIMAQIGSFVPAQYASISIRKQLLARVSVDDSIEANVSTFSAEMKEAAFILKSVDSQSMIIVDELGRGTSTRDGSTIAIAIAEALIESRALVWFATHFRDLATILAERNGVTSMHLAVNNSHADRMEMLYRIAPGVAQDSNYGIKLAKTLPLPADVISYAEHVSGELTRKKESNKATTMAIITARKRKVMLNLKEHLQQARDSPMNDEDLKEWLTELQRQFVIRMSALEEEEEALAAASASEVGTTFDDETSTGRQEDAAAFSMDSREVVLPSIEPTEGLSQQQQSGRGNQGAASTNGASSHYGSVSEMLLN